MNNPKSLLFLSCLVAVMLSAPIITAAPRGGGSGGHNFAPMGGRPGMGAWSGQRWGGGNWGGRNWSGGNWHGGNWHGGNWNNWNGNWHHHHDHDVIFIGDFGFPWWWGWGWGPWWGWDGGYPYGYYGYGYPYGNGYPYGSYGYGYGYGYGGQQYGAYGDTSRSRVAELQRRLARAGYYHGAIDGVLGPQTRRAIRAYERNRGYAS